MLLCYNVKLLLASIIRHPYQFYIVLTFQFVSSFFFCAVSHCFFFCSKLYAIMLCERGWTFYRAALFLPFEFFGKLDYYSIIYLISFAHHHTQIRLFRVYLFRIFPLNLIKNQDFFLSSVLQHRKNHGPQFIFIICSFIKE